MTISSTGQIHFCGIGGTAMASVAAAMQDRGFAITGSDQDIYPPMSDFLSARQIPVARGYAAANLPSSPDWVVIGNALSRGNPEVEAVLERKLPYLSLPELLKTHFIRGRRSLVVAGTHGKTTTSSLLAWTLERHGLNPSFLIGGMPNNFGQGARFTESGWIVLEGDEYDTAFFDKRSKFLHYLPDLAVINNLEFDHADIFPDLAAIQAAFRRLIQLIPRNGLLAANGDDPHLAPLLENAPCPVVRFGFSERNDLAATRLQLEPECSRFVAEGFQYTVPLTGELNVRNALGVVALARHCGLEPEGIQQAFASFQGIRRRMEIRGTCAGVTVVDDFGHHPTAIRETLRALRTRFSGRRLWAIFEPRSNTTRRNVLQPQLASALAEADAVVVAQVARLEQLPPSERLDPERLMEAVRASGRPAAYLPTVDDIVLHVRKEARAGDVLCIFSNGGFGGIHRKLLER